MSHADERRGLAERLRGLEGVRDAAVVSEPEPLSAGPLPVAELLPSAGRGGAAASGGGTAVASGRPSISRGGPLELPAGSPRTLPQALERAARLEGVGLTYLEGETAERFQSYAGMKAEAERILASLLERGLAAGDRVVFQLDRPADFLPALWACLLGGLVAVPAALPPSFRESSAALGRLAGAWELLGGPPILVRDELAERVASAPGLGELEGLSVVGIDALRRGEHPVRRHRPEPDDTALLLLTSGSTGVPKAVRQTHATLLASAAGAIQMHGFGADSVFLNWFPLDHVAGVVMFHLQPLVLGGRQLHGTMETVLKRPTVWLDWIERHAASVTWAPNFAYGQVNERAEEIARGSWDLGSMRFILNGGEAIVPRTARRFMKLLAPHGLPADAMHPGWGMSETCGGVVFSKSFSLETTADEDSFVSLGRPFPGTALRITDDAGEVVPEPVIGHLQISGPSITPGYFENPGATRAAFTADGWFDTGDLGFLHDGRMTITGRSKETIIINGVNYHGHEIEHAAEGVPGVVRSFTAACAVRRPGSDTEELAVFLTPRDDADPAELAAAVRDAVQREVGLTPGYVVPVPAEEVPKTSIGKIQRAALVARFDAGEFDGLLADLDPGGGGATVPDWFFRPVWVEERDAASAVPREVGEGAVAPAWSLLLAPAGPAGEGLAAGLADLGRLLVATPGDGFAAEGDRFRLDPARGEGFERLVEALPDGPGRVVFAWPLGDAAAPGSLAELRRAQEAGPLAFARLLGALGERPGEGWRLAVVTRGAQPVEEGDPPAWHHGAFPGLLATLRQERPALRVLHLDLDPAAELDGGAAAATLTAELADGDSEVALRGGARRVARLEKVDMLARPAAATPFEPGGIYLAPGGLGGIGLHLVRALLEHGARVVALGRTELPPREEWEAVARERGPLADKVRACRALEALGDFDYAAADVADLDSLRAVTRAAEERWGGRLAGVVHLAGVNRSRHWEDGDRHRLARAPLASWEEIFHPKVDGTWTLFRLLEERPGALFVGMSSVLGAFGGAGHAAYSAAASFMDALGARRRAAGQPRTHVVSWTMWDDVGMSRDNPQMVREATRASGFHILQPEQGLISLEAVLGRDLGRVIVGLDPGAEAIRERVRREELGERLVAWYAADEGLDESPLEALVAAAAGDGGFFGHELRRVESIPRDAGGAVDVGALAGGPAAEPASPLEREMSEIWTQVLNRTAVARDDRFFEVGGDSLKATQLLQRVSATFGVDVGLREFFDDPTVAGLAQRVGARRETATVSDAEGAA